MGPEFTPKDFRTWAGTLIAAVKLAELGATEDLEQAEKNVLETVDDVARRLGNTRDIAWASYISPRVIDHYLEAMSDFRRRALSRRAPSASKARTSSSVPSWYRSSRRKAKYR